MLIYKYKKYLYLLFIIYNIYFYLLNILSINIRVYKFCSYPTSGR